MKIHNHSTKVKVYFVANHQTVDEPDRNFIYQVGFFRIIFEFRILRIESQPQNAK